MLDNKVFLYTNCCYEKKAIKKKILSSGVLDVIHRGDKVVLKPNFVQEKHELNDDWEEMITHPAVISAVLEIVLGRLEENGEIIIADAPMTPAHFDEILAHMPVQSWQKMCAAKNIKLSIVDLRDEEWFNAPNGIILKKKKLPGDPMGKVLCNLKNESSEFYGKKIGKQGYYGACYDIEETNDAHNGTNNFYSVSRSIISADVFVNIAKLKTHKKAGITCCLKNLVGINTNKNLLPHHTSGTPAEGGDQFTNSSVERKLESAATIYAKKIVNSAKFLTPLLVPLKNFAIRIWGDNRHSVRSGGWYGNDTLWRTILDLNKVLYYANPDGSLRPDKLDSKKRYIGIVDGILAGEGNGPLAPDPKQAGFLLCGTDSVAIDCTAVKLMGFDYQKIPSVCKALLIQHYKITEYTYEKFCCCINDDNTYALSDLPKIYESLFKAALGWEGHIEQEVD